MENLIQLSFYISIVSGALLLLLLILSIIGGADMDVDLDGGADADAGFSIGGLGIIKSGLTFLSIGAWIVKVLLAMSVNPFLTILAGIGAGVLAVFILSWFLRLLLRNQSYVNWEFPDAEGKQGTVYLKIPKDGTGIIHVDIKGVSRELKAKSKNNIEIPTNTSIFVEKMIDELAEVTVNE